MLYGWLEVGASNVSVFSSQCNQDIVLRTTSSNGKIIIGTQQYDINSGSNVLAAIYMLNNNVGINKIPVAGTQLDINGKMSINNTLTFTETVSGVTNQSAFMVNSNNALFINYNGNHKIRFTHSNGINVTDTVYSTHDFYSPAFNVTSDSNLKRNITLCDPSSNVNILNSINTYDYYMYTNPLAPIKGFVAQQVEAVFPQCIKKTFGFIPSSITSVFVTKDGIIVKDILPFEISVGERIKVDSLGRESDFIVYKIMDNKIYVSGDSTCMGVKVSVMGKIGIILTIDTNQILALSVSTINDLCSRMQKLEARIEELVAQPTVDDNEDEDTDDEDADETS
jgi:hypothetical protein